MLRRMLTAAALAALLVPAPGRGGPYGISYRNNHLQAGQMLERIYRAFQCCVWGTQTEAGRAAV